MMQKPETITTEKKINRAGSVKQFPGKLHDLLTYAEMNGLDYIISWVHEGKAFMVHNQELLLTILPIFFGQTKFRSFQRQLNMWHFERVLVGPFKGAFMHPCFVRGNKQLCASISRHHLPSAEMYSQAFSSSTHQFILDRPNQLVIDRSQNKSEVQTLKLEGWNRRREIMKGIEAADYDKKPSAARIGSHITTELCDPSNKSKLNELCSLEEEEDWSLLSDCLEKVLNPTSAGGLTLEGALAEAPTRDAAATNCSSRSTRYIPIEALAPGMDEPASPETVQCLFAELGGW